MSVNKIFIIKYIIAFTIICQLNAIKTQCLPVNQDHPLCICDDQGKICDGYCNGKLVHQKIADSINEKTKDSR